MFSAIVRRKSHTSILNTFLECSRTFRAVARPSRRGRAQNSYAAEKTGRYEKRPAGVVDEEFRRGSRDKQKYTQAENFASLGLQQEICEGLAEQGIIRPTTSQSAVIKACLKSLQEREQAWLMKNDESIVLKTPDHFCLSSETGSGKTLAFLLPMIEAIKESEVYENLESEDQTSNNAPKGLRPKGIVVVPTRELADQIRLECKKLSHKAKFSSASMSGGQSGGGKKARNRLVKKDELLDILICTPRTLLNYWKDGKIFMGRVRMVAFDEADTLLGQLGGFSDDIEEILTVLTRRSKKRPVPISMFTGATLSAPVPERGRDATVSVSRLLRKYFGSPLNEYHLFPESGLDIPGNIRLTFSMCKGRDKYPELKELLQRQILAARKAKETRHLLIFCNGIPACQATDYFLEENFSEKDISFASFHGSLPPQRRKAAWADFISTEAAQGQQRDNSEIYLKILIATDVSARGLDFGQKVDGVIMFELPRSNTDFIHRVGRTGRDPSKKGYATVLVSKTRQEQEMLRRIQSELKLK